MPRLAAALRCEASLLSDAETDDVFRTQLSYYPDDLVVTEWNVALVVDDVDYADTVNVLEYLNVQLLELRYYDDVLDRYMADTFALATTRPRGLPLPAPSVSPRRDRAGGHPPRRRRDRRAACTTRSS